MEMGADATCVPTPSPSEESVGRPLPELSLAHLAPSVLTRDPERPSATGVSPQQAESGAPHGRGPSLGLRRRFFLEAL